MAIRRTDAVGTRIATADHDHVLAIRADVVHGVAGHFLVLRDQEFQRVVHAGQLTARHRQVARHFRAAGQHHGVELVHQRLRGHRLAGVVHDTGGQFAFGHHHARPERHAFGLHLLDAAVDQRLLHLEVGDAIAQQAADAVVLLEHRHVMAGAGQLLRGSQASRAGADHGHGLAGLVRGHVRRHPALFPGLVDDGVLDRLDAHRQFIDAERAGGLARCRADAAGELGEVVGLVQHLDRRLPVLAVHQVVEVRDDVVDRAAVVAERDAAVHAARTLELRFAVGQREHEFLVVLHALDYRFVALILARKFEKASRLTHVASLVLLRRAGQAGPAVRSVSCRAVAAWGAALSRGAADQAAMASRSLSRAACSLAYISPSARLYSVGKTLTNLRRAVVQSASSALARSEPV
ncbi:hypothetical protein D3C81_1078840 [compost metagenome]